MVPTEPGTEPCRALEEGQGTAPRMGDAPDLRAQDWAQRRETDTRTVPDTWGTSGWSKQQLRRFDALARAVV